MSETPEARGMMRGTSSAGDEIVPYLDKHDPALTKARHPAYVTVTSALVDAGASGTDWKADPVGWTNRQVAILDPVSKVKPVKGWRYRSDGRQITWSAAVAFLTSAKRKKLRPKPGSRAEAEAIATLKRLVAAADAACPICRGARRNHMGEPCALCIKPLAEQKTNLSVAPDTPPWE